MTCLEDVPAIFKEKSFLCHKLEDIKLGSQSEKWSINLGGKIMDNTGLTKRNQIRKINWKAPNAWNGNPLFESEYDQPKKIQEVPGN